MQPFHARSVHGPNYKATYCMAVCPAGDDVIGPFLTDRKRFLEDVVDPLQNKSETVYVVPNSDTEDHVARRFPHKNTKRVSNGLAGQGLIRSFLRGLDDLVTRLPIWPRMETEVTPLITFEARALALRPRLDELKARVRASSG
jgi:hypothetical protein